jgi:hypothetical protein
MDKAGIITAVTPYKNDPNLNKLGQKLVEATQAAIEKGKKL